MSVKVKFEAGGKILSQNSKIKFVTEHLLFFSFARNPLKMQFRLPVVKKKGGPSQDPENNRRH